MLRIAAGRPDLELVAFNDLVEPALLAPLIARDTVHGPFALPVRAEVNVLRVGERAVTALLEPDPAAIDWTASRQSF